MFDYTDKPTHDFRIKTLQQQQTNKKKLKLNIMSDSIPSSNDQSPNLIRNINRQLVKNTTDSIPSPRKFELFEIQPKCINRRFNSEQGDYLSQPSTKGSFGRSPQMLPKIILKQNQKLLLTKGEFFLQNNGELVASPSTNFLSHRHFNTKNTLLTEAESPTKSSSSFQPLIHNWFKTTCNKKKGNNIFHRGVKSFDLNPLVTEASPMAKNRISRKI